VTHGVVLVGLGAIGMGYDLCHPAFDRVCTHARAFNLHRAFGPLVGVDVDADRRRIFDATYGGPSYGSLEETLEKLAPSVVVIATPTASHLDTLIQVLEHSTPKALLCEKPLAQDPFDAQTMVATCEERGVSLYVNYMRRSDPGVNAFKSMIERGEISTPLKGVVWYSKGLTHSGSHLVDLMRHWMGPVERTTLVRAGRRWEGRDPEPDFVFEYSQGSISFLAANEECFSHCTVELVARNGRLRYEQGGERVEWQTVIDDPDFAGNRVLAKRGDPLPADMARYQLHVVNQLALALEAKNAALCTGRAGLETLRDVYRVIELL
jgi:predicted dehydrogenase